MKERWQTAMRRLMPGLLWSSLVIGMAIVVNLVGIGLIGSMADWHGWLRAHAGHFLVWRLCLYTALAFGWWRLLRQHALTADRTQLRRTEAATVIVIFLLEGGNLLRQA